MLETCVAGLTFQHKAPVRRHISSVLSEIWRRGAWLVALRSLRALRGGRLAEPGTLLAGWPALRDALGELETAESDIGSTVARIACNESTQAAVRRRAAEAAPQSVEGG